MSTCNIILILVWIVCGVTGYGITVGYFDNEYPMHEKQWGSRIFGIFIGLGGPVGLFASFILSGCCKHGLKFK